MPCSSKIQLILLTGSAMRPGAVFSQISRRFAFRTLEHVGVFVDFRKTEDGGSDWGT